MTLSIGGTSRDSIQLLMQQASQKSSITGDNSSSEIKNSVENLIEDYLEKYEESFDNVDADKEKEAAEAAAKVKTLLSKADTDKNGKLSLDELSSFDSGDDVQMAKFVKDLKEKFTKYDSNGDGLLTSSELIAAIPKKQFTEQEMASLAESMSNDDLSSTTSNSLFNSSFGDSTSLNVQKILNSYQNGTLSDLPSTLGVA